MSPNQIALQETQNHEAWEFFKKCLSAIICITLYMTTWQSVKNISFYHLNGNHRSEKSTWFWLVEIFYTRKWKQHLKKTLPGPLSRGWIPDSSLGWASKRKPIDVSKATAPKFKRDGSARCRLTSAFVSSEAASRHGMLTMYLFPYLGFFTYHDKHRHLSNQLIKKKFDMF
jgi:hypothetical protein